MTQLSDILDVENLQRHIAAGNISRTDHPDGRFVLNYSNACQYSQAWDYETMNCRGLVVAADGEVLARPYMKFFNHAEMAVPKYVLNTPPTIVTDKLDGSMVAFSQDLNGVYVATTRGSFQSEQAIWATEWLHREMRGFTQPEGVTTLAEVIYPANRIVVPYGERAECVLHGAIDIATGADIPLWEIDWWEGARAEQYTGLEDMDNIYRFATGDDKEDEEGVVATWYRPGEPSFRLKVKHSRYLRLHRILTGITARRIWEIIARGDGLDEILDRVPDEFYDWVQATVTDLRTQHADIEFAACAEFAALAHLREDRKAFAHEAVKSEHRGLLFALLDDKDISPMIWAQLRPEHEKPWLIPRSGDFEDV